MISETIPLKTSFQLNNLPAPQQKLFVLSSRKLQTLETLKRP